MFIENTVHFSNSVTPIQKCGSSEPIAGHFGLFSTLLSCSPFTLYTAQFQFTRHSLAMSYMTGFFSTFLAPYPVALVYNSDLWLSTEHDA